MKNHLNYRVLLTFFAVLILGAFVFPNGADALTLTPIRFELRGNPGEVLKEEILLINESTLPEIYYASFANFEAQGDSGTPAFVEPQDDLGTWMSTENASIDLGPRQQKIVPFTITIPRNAEPGGHFAVVFWGTSPSTKGGAVSVGAKTGVLVLLSVNGDVKEEAGLLDFQTTDKKFFYQTLPVSMEYRFKNDGGDRVKPDGKITIRNTFFLPTERLDANPSEGNVLPGSTRKFKVDWLKYQYPEGHTLPANSFKKFWSDVGYQWKNFAVGLYSAKLNVAYGSADEHVGKTVFFFVFPWQLVLVLIIVFIILFWGGKNLIGRYNKFIIEKARAGIKLPPTSHDGQL